MWFQFLSTLLTLTIRKQFRNDKAMAIHYLYSLCFAYLFMEKSLWNYDLKIEYHEGKYKSRAFIFIQVAHNTHIAQRPAKVMNEKINPSWQVFWGKTVPACFLGKETFTNRPRYNVSVSMFLVYVQIVII